MWVQGTTYHDDTPQEVIRILECARLAKFALYGQPYRLRLFYGDAKTGQAWGDVETGYIGRSMGPVRIPIVRYNCLSVGGPGILDNCIVRIEKARKEHGQTVVLYQHPGYTPAVKS